MIGISNSVGAYRSFVDPSASAYFAATGITGATEQQAVNTLVTSLKSAGLWSKMKAVYPFVTDNRNLLSYTEDFGNAAWSTVNASISANNTTSPDGTANADKLTEDSSNAIHVVYTTSAISTTAAQSYTASIFYKKGTRRYFSIKLQNGLSSYTQVFDADGVTTGASSSNGLTGVSTSIISIGNGWVRASVTGTSSTTGAYVIIGLSDSASPTFDPSNFNPKYTGTGTDYGYVWGAQLELGSSATTYQPIATTQQSYISSQFKYNLVNPVDSDAAFRGVFNGGWTFSNQGATPNGTNGYMDTKLVPSSVLALNNTSTSVYSRTNSAVGMTDLGANDLASNRILMAIKYSNNFSYIDMYDALNSRIAYNLGTSSSLGLFVANRTNSTIFNYWKNDAKLTTNTNTQLSSLPNKIIYIGANNSTTIQDYSNRQYAFAHIADGLTDTEATALYNAVQTFNQTLQRQV